MTTEAYCRQLERMARRTLDDMAYLQAALAHPDCTDADRAGLARRQSTAASTLGAVRFLQQRLVSDDTTDRAYRDALLELERLASTEPGSGWTRDDAAAQANVYTTFLMQAHGFARDKR